MSVEISGLCVDKDDDEAGRVFKACIDQLAQQENHTQPVFHVPASVPLVPWLTSAQPNFFGFRPRTTPEESARILKMADYIPGIGEPVTTSSGASAGRQKPFQYQLVGNAYDLAMAALLQQPAAPAVGDTACARQPNWVQQQVALSMGLPRTTPPEQLVPASLLNAATRTRIVDHLMENMRWQGMLKRCPALLAGTPAPQLSAADARKYDELYAHFYGVGEVKRAPEVKQEIENCRHWSEDEEDAAGPSADAPAAGGGRKRSKRPKCRKRNANRVRW